MEIQLPELHAYTGLPLIFFFFSILLLEETHGTFENKVHMIIMNMSWYLEFF